MKYFGSDNYVNRALVVVDVQRDFCEGGALPVAGGGLVGYHIADAMRQFHKDRFGRYQYIIATKDFHLPGDSNGGHFSENPDYVSTWPAHCVQGTEGAMFHPAVANAGVNAFDAVFYKGQGRPAYSGFQGVTPVSIEYARPGMFLLDWLTDRQVTELDIVGIATDYCVKATALDAIEFGFKVYVPKELTVAVGGEGAKIEAIRQVNAAQGREDAIIN